MYFLVNKSLDRERLKSLHTFVIALLNSGNFTTSPTVTPLCTLPIPTSIYLHSCGRPRQTTTTAGRAEREGMFSLQFSRPNTLQQNERRKWRNRERDILFVCNAIRGGTKKYPMILRQLTIIDHSGRELLSA